MLRTSRTRSTSRLDGPGVNVLLGVAGPRDRARPRARCRRRATTCAAASAHQRRRRVPRRGRARATGPAAPSITIAAGSLATTNVGAVASIGTGVRRGRSAGDLPVERTVGEFDDALGNDRGVAARRRRWLAGRAGGMMDEEQRGGRDSRDPPMFREVTTTERREVPWSRRDISNLVTRRRRVGGIDDPADGYQNFKAIANGDECASCTTWHGCRTVPTCWLVPRPGRQHRVARSMRSSIPVRCWTTEL